MMLTGNLWMIVDTTAEKKLVVVNVMKKGCVLVAAAQLAMVAE